MAFCFELETTCCDCTVRHAVCIALLHYIFHGILIVSFVFSNICYPPFYYVDYLLGGSGGVLVVISLFTLMTIDLKNYQAIRVVFAFLTVLNVLAVVVATYFYVITRWNDVIVTALIHYLREGKYKEFPDELWYTFAILLCIVTPVLLVYLICISSFMCNKWKSHLFSGHYRNDMSVLFPPLTMPSDKYPSSSYRAQTNQRADASTKDKN